jgi:uncharacterized protein YcbK (DUF882 family)
LQRLIQTTLLPARLLLIGALFLLPAAAGTAHAGKSAQAAQSSKSSKSKKSKSKRGESEFSGHLVPLGQLRAEPLPRPSGNIKIVNINFRSETLEVNIYNPDGSFNEEALDQLNHFWRCKRTGTEKPINAHLFELLSHIYDHFQSPIELVSGFRNQEHTTSFHFHGSASDIRVQGVEPDDVLAFAQSLDAGGMGIGRYPRAHFVHIDVRPEPSYRWTDRSPPGGDSGKSKKSKKRHNA